MTIFTKEDAKRSISNLVGYLKQNLVHTDLERENRSKGYKFISLSFDDFKNNKKEIRVAASMISGRLEDHFGPTTKDEMEVIARVFSYGVQFIPKKREEIPTINLKGSRQYYTEVIFRKI